MKRFINVSLEHLELVRRILKKHLSNSVTVWVFGSRTTNHIKKYSDLDLLIDAEEPLSLATMASLTEDFEESELPYKVDIVDNKTINPSFRNKINQEKIILWQGYREE